jgi:hypothetical protein
MRKTTWNIELIAWSHLEKISFLKATIPKIHNKVKYLTLDNGDKFGLRGLSTLMMKAPECVLLADADVTLQPLIVCMFL